MGRNGNKAAVFPQIMEFINTHVNYTVTSKELLLGGTPGRNAGTSYLYTLNKLGYIEPIDNGSIMSADTLYKVKKPFAMGYKSAMLKYELRIVNGLKERGPTI